MRSGWSCAGPAIRWLIEQVVGGFTQAYSLDEGYRIAHHGADLMRPENWLMQALVVKIDASAETSTALEEHGLKVTAFAVDHAPVAPAYGYRFDYRGRSVVISGDTVKCANLVAQAKGADLLISEAQSPGMVELIQEAAQRQGNDRVARIMRDIRRYHTTPVEAPTEANDAGVQLLVLSHLGPPTQNAVARMAFMRGVSAVRPRGVAMGSDGTLITLPAESKAIQVSTVD